MSLPLEYSSDTMPLRSSARSSYLPSAKIKEIKRVLCIKLHCRSNPKIANGSTTIVDNNSSDILTPLSHGSTTWKMEEK